MVNILHDSPFRRTISRLMLFHGKCIMWIFSKNTNFGTWWKTQVFLFSKHKLAFREVGPLQAFNFCPLPPHLRKFKLELPERTGRGIANINVGAASRKENNGWRYENTLETLLFMGEKCNRGKSKFAVDARSQAVTWVHLITGKSIYLCPLSSL